MNNDNTDQQVFNSKLEGFELTPLQVIGILVGLGLLAVALFQIFKSSGSSTGTVLSAAPKLSATELASMLAT